jgi:hypothetical protein
MQLSGRDHGRRAPGRASAFACRQGQRAAHMRRIPLVEERYFAERPRQAAGKVTHLDELDTWAPALVLSSQEPKATAR